MNKKKFLIGIASFLLTFSLAACFGNNKDNTNKTPATEENVTENGTTEVVPKDLKVAKNPKYKVGDKVIVNATHMEGMKGAEATVVGAYDTTVYSVDYTPTTGGDLIKGHKWVIQEELKDGTTTPYTPGSEVTINATHMEGMQGAKGVVNTAEETTVYLIDYTPTTGGDVVKNHKWVVESELSPKK